MKDINKIFLTACKKNKISRIKYLLTSSKLTKKLNINYIQDGNTGLDWACINGNLELVEYLMSSKEIKTHPQTNVEHFVKAVTYEHFKVFEYLILNHFDINNTENIIKKSFFEIVRRGGYIDNTLFINFFNNHPNYKKIILNEDNQKSVLNFLADRGSENDVAILEKMVLLGMDFNFIQKKDWGTAILKWLSIQSQKKYL